MVIQRVKLHQTWEIGELIGGGGFGAVYLARSGREVAALKLVPKFPGAQREVLFAELGDTPNVVPVIDTGETDDSWAIVMPLATKTLRKRLEEAGGHLTQADTVILLSDIAEALAALNGRVVHRDIKPENILLLKGRWCLADFGIARYAEASTAPDTHKFSKTPWYAAPEQWRDERATAATDIYALGVVAYECMTGTRPFSGPAIEDLRDQHLHHIPVTAPEASLPVASLIDECLMKAPGARPSAANMLVRLQRVNSSPSSPGLAKLQQASHSEVGRRAEADLEASRALSEVERRELLAVSATNLLTRISSETQDTILSFAPAASLNRSKDGWVIKLGVAALSASTLRITSPNPWADWDPPKFDVVAHAHIALVVPSDRSGYEGRSHSFWFCDAQVDGEYAWFETGFMHSPLVGGTNVGRQHVPFALDPGEKSAKAIWNGMAEIQVAWPFTKLVPGSLEEFIDRWASWLASGSAHELHHPTQLPERDTTGSWRR